MVLVEMEPAPEEPEDEDCNYGENRDWVLVARAPFWMLKSHRVLDCGPVVFRKSLNSQVIQFKPERSVVIHNNLMNGLNRAWKTTMRR